jgi:hypothetical protein
MLLFLLAFPNLARAENPVSLKDAAVRGYFPPPVEPVDNMDLKSLKTVKSSPVSALELGMLEVEFEKTTLQDVKKSAAAGKIFSAIGHAGDASGYENWLCYTISSQEQPERVWVYSGEMGTSQNFVEGIYASSIDKPAATSEKCPELSPRLLPVYLSSSIWIGSNADQLKDLYGEPSATMDGWRIWFHTGRVSVKGTAFDRQAILEAKVDKGRIVALAESQLTTN